MPTPESKIYERFLRLFTQHEASVRAFVRSLLPSQDETDEVMQEVSVVALRKFGDAEISDGEEFTRWICTIARFEVLKFRRRMARDRLVLNDDTIQLLADEGIEEVSLRERQRRALEDCLAHLPEHHRQLVVSAYASDCAIQDIAERAGRTRDAMYQLLRRLRGKLLDCTERTLQPEVGL